MVYTPKFLIFASPNGVEVIDVIPIVEITGVRSSEDSPSSKASNASDILFGDDASDPGTDTPAATTSKVRGEALLQTEPGGYNSGRTYRVRTAVAHDATMLAEDLDRLAAAARKKLHRSSWLRGLQVALPPSPLLRISPAHQLPPAGSNPADLRLQRLPEVHRPPHRSGEPLTTAQSFLANPTAAVHGSS